MPRCTINKICVLTFTQVYFLNKTMFDALEWTFLFVATLVTYTVMVIQAFGQLRLKAEWNMWYEMNLNPVFDANRITNQLLQFLFLGSSSIGFFFMLKNANESILLWNSAIMFYVTLTVTESAWPLIIWYFRMPNAAVGLLGTAIAMGGLSLWFSLFGTTSPGLVILPILPRFAWLVYIFVYDGIYLRKKLKETQSHKNEETPNVMPRSSVSSSSVVPEMKPSSKSLPLPQQQQPYPDTRVSFVQRGSGYQQAVQRPSRQNSYHPQYSTQYNPEYDQEAQQEECPIPLPPDVVAWQWDDDNSKYIIVTYADGREVKMCTTRY